MSYLHLVQAINALAELNAGSGGGSFNVDEIPAAGGGLSKRADASKAIYSGLSSSLTLARRAVEEHGATVDVPESEIHDILEKLNDLEAQVSGLLSDDSESQKIVVAPTLSEPTHGAANNGDKVSDPAPSHADENQATKNKPTEDQGNKNKAPENKDAKNKGENQASADKNEAPGPVQNAQVDSGNDA